MTRIGMKELKTKLSKILEEVRGGAMVEISKNGIVFANIVPNSWLVNSRLRIAETKRAPREKRDGSTRMKDLYIAVMMQKRAAMDRILGDLIEEDA